LLAFPDDATISPAERFALELLTDLSSVLRLDGSAEVVRIVVAGPATEPSLAALRARDWGIVAGDGIVTIDRALLHFVVGVAGAVSEQHATAADRFNRVPASETAPVKGGFEREPVVSIAARSLASAVRAAAGRRPVRTIDPWPNGRRWAAALSHDLDVVDWWPVFTALRLAELATRGELSRLARVVASAARSINEPVVWDAITRLFRMEETHHVRSSWFVLCGSPTFATARAGDLTYRPDSVQARRILNAVKKGGHELGLHGSFVTSDDHAQFAAQRARLASLTETDVGGVRQHYLRMRAGTTPRGMAQAGFRYDSTYGFADRNGFRLGVADVVPLWDAERAAPAGVEEAPFTWMDRALSKYQRVEEPRAWIDDALVLADACRAVEGLWVGIWHPNLVEPLGFPGAEAAYARLLSELRGRDAYIAPIGELVAWRVARRALRASAFTASGDVVLKGLPDGVHRFAIRDEGGRAVITISGG
jgi:hypothetical protein